MVFRAPSVSAIIKTTPARPAREGDEGTVEQGTIEITKDGKTARISVAGGCGC